MRRRQRNSFVRTLTLIGLVLPGLIGIFVVQAKAVQNQILKTQLVLQGGPTSTSTLSSTSTPPPLQTSTNPALNNPAALFAASQLDLFAFIQAPIGTVPRPYVTLFAFGSVPQSASIVIRGFINSDEFICPQSPCQVFLQGSSRLVFRAYA